MRAEMPMFPAVDSQKRRGFSYIHIIGFEETNLIGNVYFARHIAWQGRCRELFLQQHAPQILSELSADLRIVTVRVGCEYFEEINAFDTIEIAMYLDDIRENRISLDFVYRRVRGGHAATIAHGFQVLCCMRARGGDLVRSELPECLVRALKPYREGSNGVC